MASPLIMRVMGLSISTAKRAGGIIRDVMKKGELKIVDKGKNDLQTEADRSAQSCIIASLSKQFPTLKIIGEEGATDMDVPGDWLVVESDSEFVEKNCPDQWRNIKDEDFVIWVDPLDGTSEYTQGFVEHVTVLIGVAVKGLAVGGVIHQPFYKNACGNPGRTIWGLKGLGAGGFEPKTAPVDKFIVTTTRSHMNPVTISSLEILQPSKVLKVGGAGYKVIQLLEGEAHAYIFASAGCKKWDTCAPEAVLESQGGVLTDMRGSHYSYEADVEHVNSFGVLATMDRSQHADILQRIPVNVAERCLQR